MDNVAMLKTTVGASNNQIITTKGYYITGDGGDTTYYWNSLSIAAEDGGSVIQVTGTSTGRWIAVFDNDLVNVKQFGAKGDGVQDELSFLENAASYCGRANKCLTLFFPNGVYRISDQWVIGTKIVPVEEELFHYPYYSCPSLNYGNESNWRPFRVIGSYDSVIHADFSSTTIKSAIYYCIRMNTGTSNRDEFGGEISNLKIVGQGSYINDEEQTLFNWQSSKNQCGLMVLSGIGMKFDNLYFKNMNKGMNLNTSYNAIVSHWVANYCEYGWFEIGSNTGNRNAFHCFNYELAYEVRSALLVWEGMWAEGVNTVLKIYGSNNTIKGFYNEAHQRELSNQKFVIEIGLPSNAPDYNPDGVNGTVFDGLFLPASYTDLSIANGIRMRDGARNVSIIGGHILANVQFDNAANNLVYINSWQRSGTVTGPSKIYHLNSISSLKQVTVDKRLESVDDLELRSAQAKTIKALIATGVNTSFIAYTANQYGVGIGTEITDPATRFQVNGVQRYTGSRIENSNRIISDWFIINLTGSQDTAYFNIGNYTGAASNRIGFEIILDAGYVTSSPISIGKLSKRFSVQFGSNGISISAQNNEIVEDVGAMSSVFAIGDLEVGGSGVLRVPIKLLSGVSGMEKRAHARMDFYSWNGVNLQYVLNVAPVISLSTTGVFGIKQQRIFKVVKKAVFSGNGINTDFNIPHGLIGTPIASVTAASVDAAGISYITENSTYIIVHFSVAPPIGTDNVVINWIANF
jgi:hypothetical protein